MLRHMALLLFRRNGPENKRAKRGAILHRSQYLNAAFSALTRFQQARRRSVVVVYSRLRVY